MIDPESRDKQQQQHQQHQLRYVTPELIVALDDLIDKAITFGGDYSQAWISLQVERKEVRQLTLLPAVGFSVRIPNSGRS